MWKLSAASAWYLPVAGSSNGAFACFSSCMRFSSRLPSSTMSASSVANFASRVVIRFLVLVRSFSNSSCTPATVLRNALSTWSTPALTPRMASSTSFRYFFSFA